ncbi:MAG: secondary thiamine-phosphate synthase enzyme YjbQ [Nitrospira sp.]|nr:secondary thiamine-phosphate synthase enzyme YjbQ [Nitrospira sp.]
MPVSTHNFSVMMQGHSQIENISEPVRRFLASTSIQAGLVTIFVKHTTASVLIIEDDPGLRADTKTVWDSLIPADPAWQHNTGNPGENNGHSHLRGQIQGQSITIPFADNQLLLGTWQEIVVLDFDTRARSREIIVQVMGE